MRINISLTNDDIERITKLKKSSGIEQTSSLLRRALILMESNLKSTPLEEFSDEDGSEEVSMVDPMRNDLKERARRNMQTLDMVDTPRGRMTREAARISGLTVTEKIAIINGTEPKKEEVDSEKRMYLKRKFPEATKEQIDYYMSLETDTEGNLIYE